MLQYKPWDQDRRCWFSQWIKLNSEDSYASQNGGKKIFYLQIGWSLTWVCSHWLFLTSFLSFRVWLESIPLYYIYDIFCTKQNKNHLQSSDCLFCVNHAYSQSICMYYEGMSPYWIDDKKFLVFTFFFFFFFCWQLSNQVSKELSLKVEVTLWDLLKSCNAHLFSLWRMTHILYPIVSDKMQIPGKQHILNSIINKISLVMAIKIPLLQRG